MKRILSYCILLIVATGTASAQQQATYSQYMFNGLAINPAYAGSHHALSASFLARFQNVGLPGAPTTQTFSVHTPLANERVAVGFLIVNDNISVVSQTGINGIYAYRLPTGNRGFLSLGIQAGISNYQALYSQLVTYQQDALFAGDIRQVRPNFGFGLYFNNDKWYAGLSMPHMMNNVFDHGVNFETIHQSVPIIATGGIIFPLTPTVQMKPNFLFKWVDQRAVELDLNTNFLFDEVLWLGVSYRLNQSIDWLVEFQINDQFRLGYAYTTSLGPIRAAELGSHEILVNYRFKKFSKGVVTPRSF